MLAGSLKIGYNVTCRRWSRPLRLILHSLIGTVAKGISNHFTCIFQAANQKALLLLFEGLICERSSEVGETVLFVRNETTTDKRVSGNESLAGGGVGGRASSENDIEQSIECHGQS